MPTARLDPLVLPQRPHPRQVPSQLLPRRRQVPSLLLRLPRRVLVLPASMIQPTGMMNTRMTVLGMRTVPTALITVTAFLIQTLVPRPTRLAVSAEEEPRRPRLRPRQVLSLLLLRPRPGQVQPASTTQPTGMIASAMAVPGMRMALTALTTEATLPTQLSAPPLIKLAASAEEEPRPHHLHLRRVLAQLLPHLRHLLPIHATQAPVRMEVSAVAQDLVTPALVSPATPAPIARQTSTSVPPTPVRMAAAVLTASMSTPATVPVPASKGPIVRQTSTIARLRVVPMVVLALMGSTASHATVPVLASKVLPVRLRLSTQDASM